MALTMLDPTAQPETQSLQLTARPDSLRGKRLALVKNGKHNSEELLEEIYSILEAELEPSQVLRRTVPITRPAPDELLDEIAKETDLVIQAIGD